MKTKVDEQAVRDLLKVVHFTPRGVRKILETLRNILPNIIDCDDEGQVGKIIRDIVSTEFRGGSENDEYILNFSLSLYRCTRELDYYTDKRSVVEATLKKVIDLESKAERLKNMQLQARDIFHKLDERTKAILEIKSTLESTGGEINVDFCNLLDDIDIDPASVETLRNEPELAPLVDAYKLAREIIGMS